MKSEQYKSKTAAKKASKPSNGSDSTARPVLTGNGKRLDPATAVSYKPGSLLARSGGMVPTVELSKRAAQKIS